jgi:predicted ATPase
MRIREFHIRHWRGFGELDVYIPRDSTLICFVGENGTGKSSILELLRFAMSTLGMRGGSTESPNLQNLVDETVGRLSVVIDLELPNDFDLIDAAGPWAAQLTPDAQEQLREASMNEWDGSIQWVLDKQHSQPILRAGGVSDDELSVAVADLARSYLRRHDDAGVPLSIAPPFNLYLGSDRWFPSFKGSDARNSYMQEPPQLPTDLRHFIVQWVGNHLDRGHRALQQWPRDLMAARDLGELGPERPTPPVPSIPVLDQLLPYLRPSRTDLEENEVFFDSRGREVTFSLLSSGEKDLVALSLLIDTATDEQSIVLFDEPELHINPDLVRTRLAVLKSHLDGGQVLIATHSFEAVEAAGEASTFVLRRSNPSGPVDTIESWGQDPTFAFLATSLGVPAFTFADRRFVFIEGEGKPDEVNKFDKSAGDLTDIRFMGMGGWDSVLQHLAKVSSFACLADRYRQLRLGAIIDRDFLSDDLASAVAADGRVHVLTCLQEENFFLDPDSITEILRQDDDPRRFEALLQ